jgi:hypothetical protein
LLDADEHADVAGQVEAGDGVPHAVVGVDEHAAGVLAQDVGEAHLGLDDFLVGGGTVLALLLQAAGEHLDQRAVLVGGDHGQGAVVVADPLQSAEFAGGQAEPVQSRHARDR